jgi:hypothetical protein
MRKKLDAWLDTTGAKLPFENPKYDAELAEKQKENIRSNLLPRLERQHARFLDPDFKPNDTWWGSTKD